MIIRVLTVAGPLALLSSAPLAVLAEDAAPAANGDASADEFATAVRPLLAEYCLPCHGPRRQRSDINLALFETEASIAGDEVIFRQWAIIGALVVQRSDAFTIELIDGGGFVARFLRR